MAKYNMSEQDAEKVLSKLLKVIDTVKFIETAMEVVKKKRSVIYGKDTKGTI